MTLTRINTNSITDGSIVNADISASAAIAGTKISPDFGSQNIVTTGGLTVDTNTLVVDAPNNRVGIGTTPESIFHVKVATNENIRFTGGSGDTRIACFNDATSATTQLSIQGSPLLFRSTGGSEAARIDTSSRLLVGTSSATNNLRLDEKFAVVGTSASYPGMALTGYTGTASDYCPLFEIQRSRGTTDGSYTKVENGDCLGKIMFRGADGSSWANGAYIEAYADAATGAGDLPTRLVFSTTADGASSPTEAFRINSFQKPIFSGPTIRCLSTYNSTTASAANQFVDSAGDFYRSTSSIKYKTNVETIEDQYSDALLQCRPVWYQSTCEADNPDWGHWGFIAEEVAQIDPRLCFFKEEEDGTLEPEGVQYDRFVPHLLNLIKRQKEQIEALEARLTAAGI